MKITVIARIGMERTDRTKRRPTTLTLSDLPQFALRQNFPQPFQVAKKLVRRRVDLPFATAQLDERLTTIFQASFFFLVGEACKPTEVPPISTTAVSSEPQGKLPRGERTQKAIGKSSVRGSTIPENCQAKSRPLQQARNPTHAFFRSRSHSDHR